MPLIGYHPPAKKNMPRPKRKGRDWDRRPIEAGEKPINIPQEISIANRQLMPNEILVNGWNEKDLSVRD